MFIIKLVIVKGYGIIIDSLEMLGVIVKGCSLFI